MSKWLRETIRDKKKSVKIDASFIFYLYYLNMIFKLSFFFINIYYKNKKIISSKKGEKKSSKIIVEKILYKYHCSLYLNFFFIYCYLL